jgi:hypothetical protein
LQRKIDDVYCARYLSHPCSEDEETKEIEEKILIPGRKKLANAANVAAGQRDEYIKTLSSMIATKKAHINYWNNQVRSNLIRKLDELRKEYVEESLREFEIPFRTKS